MAKYDYNLGKNVCDLCGLDTDKTVQGKGKWEWVPADHDNCMIEGVSPLLREIIKNIETLQETVNDLSSHMGVKDKDPWSY